MGISIPAGFTIAGFNIDQVKSTLKRVRLKGTLGRTLSAADFLDGDRSASILLQELLDRGDIALPADSDPTQFYVELTDAGRSLLASKTVPRTPIAEADLVLERFLERIKVFNDDPDNPEFIEQAWLFGSVMRREETVGDIDIAVSLERKPQFEDSIVEHLRMLLKGRSDVPHFTYEAHRFDWLRRRFLFGPRKHHLLAGVDESTDELQRLAVSCQLVFDRSRGGRVHDAPIARHPLSEGRCDSIRSRAELSKTPPLRPTDARWVTGFHNSMRAEEPISRHDELHDEHAVLFPARLSDLFVVADPAHLPDGHWRPRIETSADGCRERAIFVGGDRGAGVALSLNRSVEEREDVINLRVSLGDFVFQARQAPVVRAGDFARFIALVVAADCERAVRRELDGANPRRVVLELDDTSVDNRFSAEVTRALSAFLEFGYVRLVPRESDFQVEVRIGQARPLPFDALPSSTLTI